MKPADAMQVLQQHFATSSMVKQQAVTTCGPSIVRAAELIAECFTRRGRLLLCGNGGSAADCQHIAAEFVSTLRASFPRAALGAIALTTDTSFLTANANDFGFEGVFARQVEALGQKGDVLLGITTSGNSANVLRALEMARRGGLSTIAFTGDGGGKCAALADVLVAVPSTVTGHIQETHITAAHVLCDLVERALWPIESRA